MTRCLSRSSRRRAPKPSHWRSCLARSSATRRLSCPEGTALSNCSQERQLSKPLRSFRISSLRIMPLSYRLLLERKAVILHKRQRSRKWLRNVRVKTLSWPLLSPREKNSSQTSSLLRTLPSRRLRLKSRSCSRPMELLRKLGFLRKLTQKLTGNFPSLCK